MTVGYTRHRDRAAVDFSGALDGPAAAELVDVVDRLVGDYAVIELNVTSPGGSERALERVLAAIPRWEGEGVRAVTRVLTEASGAGALRVALGAECVVRGGLARRAGARLAGLLAPGHWLCRRIGQCSSTSRGAWGRRTCGAGAPGPVR